ncbi:stress-activated protein kinase alpha-like [Oppia nitens]|uniref:stress-activated protein kinase alpha-like n=1 Tax=Oppia nitens TaxID=1686743 RepID=UPI0023DA27C6|nr:stress-activated protein kinase alpha-like [Oppia nitens]
MISIGCDFALCITSDQQIYSWGLNYNNQLGRHISDKYSKPAVITYLSDIYIIDITSGSHHSLALSSDGTVYGWGLNTYGQCGCGQQQNDCIKTPIYQKQKLKILDEVKQLLKLQSKFVVNCLDAWLESKKIYIQMDLYSQSLNDIIKLKSKTFQRQSNEPMDCIEYYITSHIMLEMCECVEYLHTRQPPVIHRDLKPANILINDRPVIDNRFLKLCDFGLSTDHNRTDSQSDSHTSKLGTIGYTAPEVFKRDYNEKSDIYKIIGNRNQWLIDKTFMMQNNTRNYQQFVETFDKQGIRNVKQTNN